MATTTRRQRHTVVEGESFQAGEDSCPVLGDDDEKPPESDVIPLQIRDVRRVDTGTLSTRRTLLQRIHGHKNRFVQRVLVACHLTEASRDITFKQEQTSNTTAIGHLTALRDSLVAHSQSIVNMSVAICCFAANSSRSVVDDPQDSLAALTAQGQQIRDDALVFNDLVERMILSRVDRHISELESINSLISVRVKLVLDVDYARRKLVLEQQRGKTDRIAGRKQALQSAQRDCERATSAIADQLRFMLPTQGTDLLELFQEYSTLVAQYFTRSGALVRDDADHSK